MHLRCSCSPVSRNETAAAINYKYFLFIEKGLDILRAPLISIIDYFYIERFSQSLRRVFGIKALNLGFKNSSSPIMRKIRES